MYQKRNFPQPFKTKLPSSRLTVHRQFSYQLHSFLVCQLKAHFAHHSRKKSHVNLWSFEKYEMLSSKTLYNNYFKKQYNIKEGFFIWRKIKNSKIYIYRIKRDHMSYLLAYIEMLVHILWSEDESKEKGINHIWMTPIN